MVELGPWTGLVVAGAIVCVGLVYAVHRVARARAGVERAGERMGGAGGGEAISPAAASETAIPGGGHGAELGTWHAALARTRALFSGLLGPRVDEGQLVALEEALIRADVGPRLAGTLVAEVRGADDAAQALRERIAARLRPLPRALNEGGPPRVILVVGVNGSGKTTTIGKLAARLRAQGLGVILGAGDTFRAGAIEQLKAWGERVGVPVIAQPEGSDPASVAHQVVEAGKARGVDVVICDTAGRLQAQKALMDELAKIRRVVGKLVPGAPHEVLLVLDGTMGQNALAQARNFGQVAGVTGVVLTKLDGTARGGVVVAIAEELGLPVKLVGLGEGVGDLREFDPELFASAIAGVDAP
jgi:fused signal recognition particle receptor